MTLEEIEFYWWSKWEANETDVAQTLTGALKELDAAHAADRKRLERAMALLEQCSRGTNNHPFCPGCGKMRDMLHVTHTSWCPLAAFLAVPSEPAQAWPKTVSMPGSLVAAGMHLKRPEPPRQAVHRFECVRTHPADWSRDWCERCKCQAEGCGLLQTDPIHGVTK